VLTETGVAFAQTVVLKPTGTAPAPVAPPDTTCPRLVPTWDASRQELRVGNVVVKQFKVPAPNQEVILAAFEEEQWPPRIDDPLPPVPSLDSKRRLHETITSLNRNQKHSLISFHGDGSGQGIRWELAVVRNHHRLS
jgi:hypothetical protein